MTSIKKNIILIILIFFIAFQVYAEDANVDVVSGLRITAHVEMDSSEPINAIEGSVLFPPDLLKVIDISYADSIINFWIEEPSLNRSGIVSFAGITPGGFEGLDNRIFAIAFEAIGTGQVNIETKELIALPSDGSGIPVEADIAQIDIKITKSEEVVGEDYMEDIEPPENFQISIASNPELFEGKYFIVFSTQDKNSGVDYYDVKEGMFGLYRIAESPHLLRNQALDKIIYVRAVDKSGNKRTVSIGPIGEDSTWRQIGWVAIISLIIVIVFLSNSKWKKSKR